MLGALAVTLGQRVQERMGEAAGCSPLAVTALQWIARGRHLRSRDLVEALEITSPGASQLVRSLIVARLARAMVVGEVVTTLPFAWRLRLIRIVEKLLAQMVHSKQSVLELCRHCDWDSCRDAVIEPCPVAVAYAEWKSSSRLGQDGWAAREDWW